MSQIVTTSLATLGMSVKPGKDFNTYEYPKNHGTIIYVHYTGWCTVKWDDGDERIYRIGYGGKYDLYVYDKINSSHKKSKKLPPKWKKGDTVTLIKEEFFEKRVGMSIGLLYTISEIHESNDFIRLAGLSWWHKIENFEWGPEDEEDEEDEDYEAPDSGYDEDVYEEDEIRKIEAPELSQSSKNVKIKTQKYGRPDINPVKVRRPIISIARPERRSSERVPYRGSKTRLRCVDSKN